jgi:hypothetical protein
VLFDLRFCDFCDGLEPGSTTGSSASDDETSDRGLLSRGSILQGRGRVFCGGKMLITIVSLGFGKSRFFGGTWHSQCVYRSCLSARVFDLNIAMILSQFRMY